MDRIALAFSPLRDASPRDIIAWARRAETLGYDGVFIPESYCDSLAYAEAVALATERLRVGTAITNVYLRHPTLLAAEAAAVQELSGGRLLLGVGVGHRVVNEPLGIDMSDPLGKMRDVIGTLRAAWTKGPHQPRPAVPPLILAAALAPRMIELAGELADGAIFNLFPLARYPRALAALHEAKRMLARYANLPFYGNMLAASGFRNEVEAVRAAWRTRDVSAAERAVSDAMADAVTLAGDPARCRERLRAYRMAGAALTIVFPNPVGESRAVAVERTLVAFAPRSSL